MAKLDAKKESISFLTKLFFVIIGVGIIILGGLISMFKEQTTDVFFGLAFYLFLPYHLDVY